MAGLPSFLPALCTLLLLGAGQAAHIHKMTAPRNANFVATRMTQYRELETRLSYDGIDAIETVVPSLGEQGLFYRKVTNGKQIVTSIYQHEGLLADCDVSRDEGDLAKFYDNFLGVNSRSSDSDNVETGNNTMRTIEGDLDDQFKPIVNFNHLKTECRELHRYLRQQAKLKKKAAKKALQLDDDWPLDAEDDANDVAPTTHDRQKRAMFIYPGTNWCGTGNTAKNFHDLGENSATDKCCRAHDHCPYVIEGFTTKYNLFNVRFHTLSHCQCDET